MVEKLFFELLRVSVGRQSCLSRVPSAGEWSALYGLSVKQALAGVCFCGVQRLPKEQVAHLPKQLMMQWFALAEQIKQRNEVVNERVCELHRILDADGLRACVLKGQGVAEIYSESDSESDGESDGESVGESVGESDGESDGESVGESVGESDGESDGDSDGDSVGDCKGSELGLYRQSGDIDVWVDGERDEIIRYMKAHYTCGSAVIHHIDVEVFDDVPVEVHFIPSFAYSWPRYRAYRRFFNAHREECFVSSGLGFCVPSLRFNVVYLLMHIFRHVFHEGIGLRQLMDYYFVLRNLNLNLDLDFNLDLDVDVDRWLRELGLLRFAGAVMYVEREVFGLQKKYMICEPDEKAGRFLLDEIMRAGNFGQYDPRIRDAHAGSDIALYCKNIMRIFRMVRFYPTEVLWAPFWKVGHFVWRKCKGR